MSSGLAIREDLVRRLPLPLARLYCAAHNAKTARDRHHNAYFLWEAALKLLASVALVEYAHRGRPDPGLAGRLQNLARPAVGHWREFVRLLLPVLGDGDSAFARLNGQLLDRSPPGLERARQLDAALRPVVGEGGSGPEAGFIGGLFDRLVRYRNLEFGHGAVGQRRDRFSEDMGSSPLTREFVPNPEGRQSDGRFALGPYSARLSSLCASAVLACVWNSSQMVAAESSPVAT
jgi:hypothetical protein